MEQRMRRGFMLVTVMIITAVGLLFGAGALLMFRYQCQMRIDRQHELEKVYAVRSALNYIKGEGAALANAGEAGVPLRYHTGSERDLGVLIKPVDAIFPDKNNSRHFDMGDTNGQLRIPYPKNYSSSRDYEYGASHEVTNWSLAVSAKDNSGRFGLAFKDVAETNQSWWVNIGMRDTGGWLQEDYGRRYYFCPLEYVDGNTVAKDIVRLCLIRNVTNELNAAGARHGWPLSQSGERALVFQIAPRPGASKDNNADMSISEYACIGRSITTNLLINVTNCPSQCYMGMQLAGDKVCLFYRSNKQINALLGSAMGGFVFSETKQMSAATYNYFAKEIFVGGKQYGGVFTNDEMRVQAPELRAVFEVEAASDARPHQKAQEDFLRDFKVTPAYQYDVFLEHPYSVTNRATVAQMIGTYDRSGGNKYTILTYDTHGTEHKGFRQDEREFERSGRK